MSNYDWKLDQHPASLLMQMEKQLIQGDIFISKLYYHKKYGWMSVGIQCLSHISQANLAGLTERQKHKILKYKNCWILGKRIIPMWDGEKITNPLLRGESKKTKFKKLLILRDAYYGTDKQEKVLNEISRIERELEMTIEEYLC